MKVKTLSSSKGKEASEPLISSTYYSFLLYFTIYMLSYFLNMLLAFGSRVTLVSPSLWFMSG
jgi:hypothetical protein